MNEEEKAKEIHNKVREILISYGNPEYGDCIVDEICFLFGFPTTNDVEDAVNDMLSYEVGDFELTEE